MKVVVLGAGLAGVTTAWYLAREGHEVVVVDRERAVAGGASGACTGIVAASRSYPWTGGELGRAMRQAAVRFDPELWLWGTQHVFLRSGGSYGKVLEAKVRLVRYSQPLLNELAKEIGFTGLQSGVLYLYREASALDDAAALADRMRAHGFTVERLERAQLAEHEPAIDAARLAGALHAPGDQAGNAGAFLHSLAARCTELGVVFSLGNEIISIEHAGNRVSEVITQRGPIRGDAYVCALGVMDRRLREQLGTHVPVYPVTGFSCTVPLARAEAAPRHAGIDETRRVAYAPMGDAVRVTGGAEYAGYARGCTTADAAPLYDAVKQLFPGALDYARATMRACRRPMTPETTPRFGTGRYQNLWFNIGLGHMGFALSAGAARITADQVCGRNAAIDLAGLRIRRH